MLCICNVRFSDVIACDSEIIVCLSEAIAYISEVNVCFSEIIVWLSEVIAYISEVNVCFSEAIAYYSEGNIYGTVLLFFNLHHIFPDLFFNIKLFFRMNQTCIFKNSISCS